MIDNSKDISFNNSKYNYIIIVLLIVLFFVFILNMLTGYEKIPVKEIIKIISGKSNANSLFYITFIDIRLPKALTAILAGSALAVSGLQMQTIFRNPLAGPYVLGISSGASLGVALLILGSSVFLPFLTLNIFGMWLQIIAAFLGAGLVLLLISFISLRIRDNTTILIMGILFGSITSAIITILQHLSNQSLLKAYIIWSMGNLSNITNSQIIVLLICVSVGLFIAILSIKPLNALLLGENYARSLGINITFWRITIFISTSILAGSITAFCGPIGFIGIIVPHLSRILFQTNNHAPLITGTILIGCIIMLASDIISSLPGLPLPINAVTSLIGIPIIMWILLKNIKISKTL